MHYDSKYHKNCDIILTDVEHGDTEFNLACRLYFKHIFDLDYAIDIHNMICNTINTYCQGKSVVHTTHFDYSDLFQFTDMINFHNLFLNHRGNVNHYTKIGNYKIYQLLLKVL